MMEENNITDAFQKSQRSRVSEVTLMGDRNIIVSIITLLSYIRNSLHNKTQDDITVSIGKNIDNGEFEFLVNNSKCDDLKVKSTISIN